MTVSKCGRGKFLGISLWLAPAKDLTQILCLTRLRGYWRFLTLSSYCSDCSTVLLWIRTQSDNMHNMHRNTAWLSRLKYPSPRWIALIGRPLGISTYDNDNNNTSNIDNNKNNYKNYNNSNNNDNSSGQ